MAQSNKQSPETREQQEEAILKSVNFLDEHSVILVLARFLPNPEDKDLVVKYVLTRRAREKMRNLIL